MWLLSTELEQELYTKIADRLCIQLRIPQEHILKALKDVTFQLPTDKFDFKSRTPVSINEWQFKSIRMDSFRYLVHPPSGLIFKRIENILYFIGYKTDMNDCIDSEECPESVLDWVRYHKIPIYTSTASI